LKLISNDVSGSLTSVSDGVSFTRPLGQEGSSLALLELSLDQILGLSTLSWNRDWSGGDCNGWSLDSLADARVD